MGSTIGSNAGEKGRLSQTLAATLLGFLAGVVFYGTMQFWVAQSPRPVLAVTLLYALVITAFSFFFITERGRILRSAACAAGIALILAPSSFYMAQAATAPMQRLAEFPIYFWFVIGAPLCAYLLASLASGFVLTDRSDTSEHRYGPVFVYGLTQPLVAICAALFTAVGVVLLIAGAFVLENFGVADAPAALQKPWILAPTLGALIGFSIVFMRNRSGLLGGLRFLLLLLSRFAAPVFAVSGIVLLIAILGSGLRLVLDPTLGPAGLTVFCFVSMLAINGVYQNGEAASPAAWLRLSVIACAVTLPLLSTIAAYALSHDIGQTGLTPERVILCAFTGLTFLYSLALGLSLISELNWRGRRWLPLLAPLNMSMAAAWVAALLVLASPLADPWALSAQNQKQQLIQSDQAADFDLGYLKFNLGRHGEKALQDLALITDHPQADAIRENATQALNAATQWDYENAPIATEPNSLPTNVNDNGPMTLPLNPVDNPVLEESGKTPE